MKRYISSGVPYSGKRHIYKPRPPFVEVVASCKHCYHLWTTVGVSTEYVGHDAIDNDCPAYNEISYDKDSENYICGKCGGYVKFYGFN